MERREERREERRDERTRAFLYAGSTGRRVLLVHFTELSFLRRMHFGSCNQRPSSRVSHLLAASCTRPTSTERTGTHLLRYGSEQTRPIFSNRLPPQVLGAQKLIQRHLKVVVSLRPWTFPPHCLNTLIGTP